jgi:SpoVK/Ycf46/Vps4 family AAA+-type ATPase
MSAFDSYVGNEAIVKLAKDSIQTFKNTKLLTLAGIPASLSCVLYGPGGTGKTLFAKTLHKYAKDEGVDSKFFDYSGSALIDNTIGGTEKNINAAFDKIYSFLDKDSNNNAFLLFDEFDAIGGVINGSSSNMAQSQRSIAATLKTHLQNPVIQTRCFVVACTNEIQSLDQALIRDGRFNNQWKLDYTTGTQNISKLFASFLKAREILDEVRPVLITELSELLGVTNIVTPAMVQTIVENAYKQSVMDFGNEKGHSYWGDLNMDNPKEVQKVQDLMRIYFDEKHLLTSFNHKFIEILNLNYSGLGNDKIQSIKQDLKKIKVVEDPRNSKNKNFFSISPNIQVAMSRFY